MGRAYGGGRTSGGYAISLGVKRTGRGVLGSEKVLRTGGRMG